MSKVTLDTVLDHLLAALKEGLDGPGKWGFFSDSGGEAGLAKTLKSLSASEASRVTGGTSIAGHAYHLVFSLNATVLYMNGDRTPQDWAQSWSVVSVTELITDGTRNALPGTARILGDARSFRPEISPAPLPLRALTIRFIYCPCDVIKVHGPDSLSEREIT